MSSFFPETGFLVTFTAQDNTVADLDILKWDQIEYNHGGHYNPVTGEYTIPYDGVYQ